MAPEYDPSTARHSGHTLSFPPRGERTDTLRFPIFRRFFRLEDDSAPLTPVRNVSARMALSDEARPSDRGRVAEPFGDIVAGRSLDDRYLVETPIANGSMGQVWRATDRVTGQAVALKLVSGAFPLAAQAEARLRDEAAVLRFVDSPHVARIVDAGQLPSGAPYLVTEFIEGSTLQRVLDGAESLPIGEVVEWMAQAAEGLADVHELGIVHNDLKPNNVLLTDANSGARIVKLLDFGIAQMRSRSISVDSTHEVFGSPWYLSPERVLARNVVDHRADIWSLGVILFEALTKVRPFDGRNLDEVCAAVVRGHFPNLRELRPDVSEALAEVVQRCLQPRPENRYLSARLLAVDLRRVPDAFALPALGRSDAATTLSDPEAALGAPLATELGPILEARAIVRAKLEAILLTPAPLAVEPAWQPPTRKRWLRRARPLLVATGYVIPIGLITLIGVAAATRHRTDNVATPAAPSKNRQFAALPAPPPGTGEQVEKAAEPVREPSRGREGESPPRTPPAASGAPAIAAVSPGKSISRRNADHQSARVDGERRATGERTTAHAAKSQPPRLRRKESDKVPPAGINVNDVYVNERGELVDARGRPLAGGTAGGGTSDGSEGSSRP